MPPEEWSSTTLGSLCERGGGSIQTGPFGSQLHAADYVNHGVPSVMPQDIVEGQISSSRIAMVAERDAARLGRHRLQPGDIVYSRRGDVRRCALATPEHLGWLCGTGCLRVRIGNAAYAPFVAAQLSSPRAQDWVERNAVGLTMLNLNTGILGRVPLTLPTLDEQRRIVDVLDLAAARLELASRLQRESGEVLVGLRRALLFSSDTAKSVCLGKALAVNPPTALPPRTPAGFVPMAAVSETGIVDESLAERRSTDDAAGYTAFRAGDVLLAKITPCFENGKAAQWTGPEMFGFGSTEFHVLRATDEHLARLAFHIVHSAEFRHRVEASMTGSAGQRRVSADAVRAFPVASSVLDDAPRVSAILDAATDVERARGREVEQLARLSRGLREDLLTGAVRV